jgi:hypothetical protein
MVREKSNSGSLSGFCRWMRMVAACHAAGSVASGDDPTSAFRRAHLPRHAIHTNGQTECAVDQGHWLVVIGLS